MKKKNEIQILNLTGAPIHVQLDSPFGLYTIEPVCNIALLKTTSKREKIPVKGMKMGDAKVVIDLSKREITGLPNPKEGFLYVVRNDIAEIAWKQGRTDVLAFLVYDKVNKGIGVLWRGTE